MQVEIRRTSDGSDTLYRPDLDEHYHSTFGAVQESETVFIRAGLLHSFETTKPVAEESGGPLQLFEVGFGTGLNALLTQAEAEKHGRTVHYTAIEPFPLDEKTWRSLNWGRRFGSVDHTRIFDNIHQASWDTPVNISPHFTLTKISGRVEDYMPVPGAFDLIYFDAFGPDVQPELWGKDIFGKLAAGLGDHGTLVTYSVKGEVVRTLKSLGFRIEKLPGPPGKRHILRAWK
jgi:tRNA U34 5-methylaminomethyl-2-thiouridine-forming methyltransferase MnmC